MEEKNKILIVEDNIITSKHISSTLKKFGYEVSGMVNNAEAAIKSIVKSKPDIALLDINLEQDVDGIQIAEMLEHEYKVGFIFLTSYNDEETINRILKLNPLGYVIKPFNPLDLNSVIELALFKKNSYQVSAGHLSSENNDEEKQSHLDQYLFIKNGRKIDKVPIVDIDYIEADGRYTYIFTGGQKKISNTPLKTLIEKLERSDFVRTHKSYLVNLVKVDSITLSSIIIDKNEIPVSKNYRNNILAKLDIV